MTIRQGIGRSVAFTSDLTTGWGRNWVLWDHYGQFVSQMTKWVQKKEGARRYRTVIERKEEQGLFSVDVTDKQEQFINQLKIRIRVLSPSKAEKTILLDQIAPGRYEGSFPVNETGEYYITLYSEEKDGSMQTSNIGYSVPYSEEYTSRQINIGLLSELSSRTDGKVLNLNEDPPDLFKAITKTKTKTQGTRLWPYLTLIALILVLADVALRRFIEIRRL